MRFLQLNLNHCEVAQDLLEQTVRESSIDIAIISEQYRNKDATQQWLNDRSSRAAIWVSAKNHVQERPHHQSELFTWAKVSGVYIFSVYAPPSLTENQFGMLLTGIVDEAANKRPLIIAGDFNAWSVVWGSASTNIRGHILLDSLTRLEVYLMNTGSKPTFIRGERTSVIDLTFVSDDLCTRLQKWRVSDEYTHSDHRAILYELPNRSKTPNGPKNRNTRKWNAKSLDKEAFAVMMRGEELNEGTPNTMADSLMVLVKKACDASMTRSQQARKDHKQTYWWSNEIAELRKKCHRARRLAQRARSNNRENCREQYLLARKRLRRAIKVSKRRCNLELCDEVNRDLWGRPYKLVMARLKGKVTAPPSEAEFLSRIVKVLFPYDDHCDVHWKAPTTDNIPPLSEDELIRAYAKTRDAAAPGPDGVPNQAIKIAIKANPSAFLRVFETCFKAGVFPDCWKVQQLVLLPKGDKPPENPSSYRPICLLDTPGKILERIIVGRLEDFTEGPNGLSEHQFGFRKAKSTTEAIKLVVSIARDAISGKRWKRGAKKYCAIVTLDVKNAFNSARWPKIITSLEGLGVPSYLREIVASYLNTRTLQYHTEDGIVKYGVTAGVPQGSVMGPTLWNIMYDGILRIPVPPNIKIVGFADDVAVVVTGKTIEEITEDANNAIGSIRSWLMTAGLQLADQKTEAVLVTSRKKTETITLKIGSCDITSAPSIRYLGVYIDARLRFDEHLRIVGKKASKVANALAGLMPNIGGPRQTQRRLLAHVVDSITLYAAPIWHEAAKVKSYTREITAARRRSCLRVTSGYRTISSEAVGVLAGILPLDIAADERARLFERLDEKDVTKAQMKKEERQRSVEAWQRRWDASKKGRWTHRLVPNIEAWVDRRHGDLDFYLTQLLTGHGCFRYYLHRFQLDNEAICTTCPSYIEDAEHIITMCPRFTAERETLAKILGEAVSPENIVGSMLKSDSNWRAVASFAATVLKRLRLEDTARRHNIDS